MENVDPTKTPERVNSAIVEFPRVDMSFPTGQSNLNLYPSGDCNHGTERT
jgi:hypothetical protein